MIVAEGVADRRDLEAPLAFGFVLEFTAFEATTGYGRFPTRSVAVVLRSDVVGLRFGLEFLRGLEARPASTARREFELTSESTGGERFSLERARIST